MEPLPVRVNGKDASEFFRCALLYKKASCAEDNPALICTILALAI